MKTGISEPREVTKIVTAHRQREGGGFIVRRPFPSAGFRHADPFLLLDEMGPVEYRPGEAIGAPDHPHRGFETVTYVLEGEIEHEDSAGHRGRLGAGDVQWMTAGRGIVHSEMPSRAMRQRGGRMHGFQIWVNLPARDKLTDPRYQEIPRATIPEAATPDGCAVVHVIAGEALGAKAVIDAHSDQLPALDFLAGCVGRCAGSGGPRRLCLRLRRCSSSRRPRGEGRRTRHSRRWKPRAARGEGAGASAPAERGSFT
jgi:quercetin 2,3-dioxygenase